jgi:cytochrome c553
MKYFQHSAILTSILLFSAALAPAVAEDSHGPSTNVAWTIETLNLLRSGDPERGAMLNTKLECVTCHGDTGVSANDTWPSLSGQTAGYTFKVLRDYREHKLSGTQRGELMAYIVAEMSDQDMSDIASYYAQYTLPPARMASVQETAETLDLLGDPTRLIPPCSVCHGNKGQGSFPDFPSLAGQSPEFLMRSMMDFKAELRGNDVYSRMRLIAGTLTEEEIESLADYFAGKGIAVAQE